MDAGRLDPLLRNLAVTLKRIVEEEGLLFLLNVDRRETLIALREGEDLVGVWMRLRVISEAQAAVLEAMVKPLRGSHLG